MSSAPLSLSVIHRPGVLLLKPNFCSSRNCSHHSNGSDGTDSSTPAIRINTTRLQIASGPPQLDDVRVQQRQHAAENHQRQDERVENLRRIMPKRDFSSVYATAFE